VEASPEQPDFTLVIPAFNEEEELPRTLPNFLDAIEKCSFNGELVLVDNNSDDRTAEIAREHGARVVFEAHNQISRARNAGAQVAAGRFLVFIDADTTMPPELLQRALEYLESGQCVGGGAAVELDKYHSEIIRRFVGVWNWFSRKRKVAAGSFIYCLKEAFDQVGGFSTRVYAAEEFFLSKALRKWGRKHDRDFRIITEYPVISSARKADWFSPKQMILPILILTLAPFLLMNRRFCGFWYKRPAKPKEN
jgi:glycosyltransferase involved in cell wall biosynthesis